MKFEEALASMREGKKIRAVGWPNCCYMHMSSDGELFNNDHKNLGWYCPDLYVCLKADWEIYRENTKLTPLAPLL